MKEQKWGPDSIAKDVGSAQRGVVVEMIHNRTHRRGESPAVNMSLRVHATSQMSVLPLPVSF